MLDAVYCHQVYKAPIKPWAAELEDDGNCKGKTCSYLVLTARVLSQLMEIICLQRSKDYTLQTPKLFQHIRTKLQPCNKLLIKCWNCNKLLVCLLWWAWLIPTSVTIHNIKFWKKNTIAWKNDIQCSFDISLCLFNQSNSFWEAPHS